MADVGIRIDDFEDGVLPGVCAGTGAPHDRLYHVTATSRTPAWAWLALLAGPAGLFFVLLAGALLRKSAKGYLPYTDAYQERLRRRIGRAAAVAAGGLALLVVSFVGRGSTGFATLAVVGMIAGAAALILGLFVWSNPPGSLGLKLDSTGRWIEADNASSAFAVAYEQQEARRRAVRRASAQSRDDQLR